MHFPSSIRKVLKPIGYLKKAIWGSNVAESRIFSTNLKEGESVLLVNIPYKADRPLLHGFITFEFMLCRYKILILN